MDKVTCPICKRQRKRSETFPVCLKQDDDKILGRICREGDCQKRCVVFRNKRGFHVRARAAQQAIAAERDAKAAQGEGGQR